MKKISSNLFKKYIIKNWTSNLFCLQLSFVELSYSNFVYRFFQKKNTEFTNLSKIIEPNFKKSFFNTKFFPQKFYNCEAELSKLLLFFNYTHSFYLGYLSNYLQYNSYLFFSKLLINFPDQLNFCNFTEKNGLFFDLKSIVFSENLLLLKIVSKLLYQITKCIIFEKKSNFKDNNSYLNNLTEVDLIFSVSFFYTSKYSKKILGLFTNSISFYTKSFLEFESNLLIWKNFQLSIVSFVICLSNNNNTLNKMEKNLCKKNFNNIFIFYLKKIKLLKKRITREETTLFNEIYNYKKTKMIELFLASISLLRDNLINSNNIIFEKTILSFFEIIQIEFFFSYLNRNLIIIFCLSLGVFSKKSKYKLVSVLNDVRNISEKKFQKLCSLSILILIFIGTSNIEIISIILNECKVYERQKLSKLERILLLKSVKAHFVKASNFETLNEFEYEQSFITSKQLLELSIMGISLLTLGDEIASHMIMRIYGYFLMSSSLETRRITTLAIGFLSISKPTASACDYMIKLTSDNDWIINKNAIFSLGLIGTGTGNTRIQASLKCLADYYSNKIEKLEDTSKLFRSNFNTFALKIQSIVFVIRIAQGLINSLIKKIYLSTFFGEKLVNYSKVFSLLYTIYGFSFSKFIGFNSVSILIFLLGLIVKRNLIMNLDRNFKIKSIKLKKESKVLDKNYNITPYLKANLNEKSIIEDQKFFLFL